MYIFIEQFEKERWIEIDDKKIPSKKLSVVDHRLKLSEFPAVVKFSWW